MILVLVEFKQLHTAKRFDCSNIGSLRGHKERNNTKQIKAPVYQIFNLSFTFGALINHSFNPFAKWAMLSQF